MKFKPYKEYKEVELPGIDKIPSHWETNKIKYKFDLVKDPSTDKNPTVLSLTQKGIKIRDVESNEGQLAKSYEGYNTVKKGYICLNPMDLETGAASKSEYDGVISNAYFTIRPRNLDINSDYYSKYFNIHYKKKIFYGFGKGVGRPEGSGGRWTLNRETFFNFPIVLPPKKEQDNIVKFLDTYLDKMDKFIELTKKQIELLEEQKEVIINDAVTKGIDNTVEYKDSGLDWVGEIPAHWETIKLKWVIDKITDYTSNGSFADLANNVEYLDSGYARLVRLTDIRSKFNNNGVYVSKHAYKYLRNSSLKGGELLVANVGAHTGFACILEKSNLRMTLGPNMLLIKVNTLIIIKFLLYLFKSEVINYYIVLKSIESSAQPSISKSELKHIILILPPINDQLKIVDYIEKEITKIDETIELYNKQIELIKEYRTSLISSAVTGKIDVRDYKR